MTDSPSSASSPKQLTLESVWLQQIRDGDDAAWQLLIDQFEGRLLAFATARVNDRNVAEDIVQEAFVGFYRSLPNFDGSRSIEAYLYQICSYKVTDHLRRSGRRKILSLEGSASSSMSSGARVDPMAGLKQASSIMRSNERTQQEQEAIIEVLQDQIEKWIRKKDFQKLMCMELLIVKGLPNKDVASRLNLTEQQSPITRQILSAEPSRFSVGLNFQKRCFRICIQCSTSWTPPRATYTRS